MYIVDRIEGNYVVCEDANKEMHDFLLEQFKGNVKAGDVIYRHGEQFIVDEVATKARTKKIKELIDSLWED